jgi:hypothetical protein
VQPIRSFTFPEERRSEAEEEVDADPPAVSDDRSPSDLPLAAGGNISSEYSSLGELIGGHDSTLTRPVDADPPAVSDDRSPSDLPLAAGGNISSEYSSLGELIGGHDSTLTRPVDADPPAVSDDRSPSDLPLAAGGNISSEYSSLGQLIGGHDSTLTRPGGGGASGTIPTLPSPIVFANECGPITRRLAEYVAARLAANTSRDLSSA